MAHDWAHHAPPLHMWEGRANAPWGVWLYLLTSPVGCDSLVSPRRKSTFTEPHRWSRPLQHSPCSWSPNRDDCCCRGAKATFILSVSSAHVVIDSLFPGGRGASRFSPQFCMQICERVSDGFPKFARPTIGGNRRYMVDKIENIGALKQVFLFAFLLSFCSSFLIYRCSISRSSIADARSDLDSLPLPRV